MNNMAKGKKLHNRRKAQQAAKGPSRTTRRTFIGLAPYIIGGVILAGGLAFWSVKTVQADLAEQDTSIVGQGTPTVVQVHEIGCSACVNLQRETRAALAMLDDGDINYRVAYLSSRDGLAFASEYGASYTTLLLFDGDGNLSRRIVGETPRDMLRVAFLAQIAAEN